MFKRYWWMLLVMAPVGMMAGFLVAAVVTYVMPKKYESQAIIEVKPRTREAVGLVSSVHSAEFEIIKSRNSLSKVIDSLDLTNRWGVDRETAVQILKGIVQTENIRGTDLIQIRVRHTNKEDARDLAAEVARSYRDYRKEIESQSLEKGISELKKAVREQEDRVEERRNILSAIIRAAAVLDARDAMQRKQETQFEKAKRALSMQSRRLGGRKEQLEFQIEELSKYEIEQLLIYASGLDHPDSIIKAVYPQYCDLKRKIDELKASGLGERHPTIVSEVRLLKAMEGELLEGLKDLSMGSLLADPMENQKSKKEANEPNIDTQEYANAKREVKTGQALLEQMKLKLITQEINKKLPGDTIVVHEDPVIADTPVSPNVARNLVAGTTGGLLISPFYALPLMWWMNRRKK